MQNKSPLGNSRPLPTSDQELERYGVWVKAEPQDVIEEPETEYEILDAEPETTAGDVSTEPDEAFLSEEEETLLGGFDLPEDETPAAEMPSLGGEDILTIETIDSMESPALSVADALDDSVIEDSVIDIPLDDLDMEPVPESEPAAPPKAASADGTEELSLDDFGFSDEEPAKAGSADADGSEAVDLSEFGIDEDAPSPAASGGSEAVDLADFGMEEAAPTAPQPEGDVDFEPIDIDLQFDDTIPAAPEAAAEVEAEFSLDDVEELGEAPTDFEELTDFGATAPAAAPEAPTDFEIEDVTLEFSAPSAAAAVPRNKPIETASTGVDSFIDSDTSSSDGIIPEMDMEDVSLDAAAPSGQARAPGFDDLGAVERDLSGTSAPRRRAAVDEASADLLNRIASELSSIKEELVSLRGQLGALKREAAEQPAAPEAAAESAEEGAAGGFFDDEEDDTIALTGDELDNILNTADFTEEAPQEGVPLAEDLGAALAGIPGLSAPVEEAPAVDDLLPEDGDYQAVPESPAVEEPGIEELDLDEAIPAEELVEETDLSGIQEALSPLTPAPDDTSYLDGDALELAEELDLDLATDAVADQAVEEFAPDELSIEASAGEDELVLSIDAEEPPAQAVDDFADADAMELEEIPEDEGAGGFELHHEETETVAAGDEAFEDIEELALADEEPSSAFGDLDESPVIKPATPVKVHPDEISMSLDDSFFVGSESGQGIEDLSTTEEAVEEIEAIEEIEEIEEVGEEPVEAIEVLEEFAPDEEATPVAPAPPSRPAAQPETEALHGAAAPDKLKQDIKSVLVYLDQLLASLPEEKIEEFASSEYYDTYRKLFDELGLL